MSPAAYFFTLNYYLISQIMEHKLSHSQRLLQKMALTPQMRQSIQLLAMSVKDLSDYIDSALAQNPFLQKLVDKKSTDRYEKGHSYIAEEDLHDHSERLKENVNPRLALLSQLKMSGISDKMFEIAEY